MSPTPTQEKEQTVVDTDPVDPAIPTQQKEELLKDPSASRKAQCAQCWDHPKKPS